MDYNNTGRKRLPCGLVMRHGSQTLDRFIINLPLGENGLGLFSMN